MARLDMQNVLSYNYKVSLFTGHKVSWIWECIPPVFIFSCECFFIFRTHDLILCSRWNDPHVSQAKGKDCQMSVMNKIRKHQNLHRQSEAKFTIHETISREERRIWSVTWLYWTTEGASITDMRCLTDKVQYYKDRNRDPSRCHI